MNTFDSSFIYIYIYAPRCPLVLQEEDFRLLKIQSPLVEIRKE